MINFLKFYTKDILTIKEFIVRIKEIQKILNFLLLGINHIKMIEILDIL